MKTASCCVALLVLTASLPGAEPRTATGVLVSASGTLLSRQAPDKPWQAVAEKATVESGDLLVSLPGAELDSKSGSVRLTFQADMEGTSPYPVLECGIVLHANPNVDLDFTLDRGRLEASNRRADGPARIRLHVLEQTWDLTLEAPGSAIGLELYSRWPRGVRFDPKPTAKEAPLAHLIFLVTRGRVSVKHGDHEHSLAAPPGPAFMEWTSVSGHDSTPRFLEELPTWAQEPKEESADLKRKKAQIERFRQAALATSPEEAVKTFSQSENPSERRAAIILAGALDRLELIGDTLSKETDFDVWNRAVLVLRHWISRGPGQDQKLYQGLIALRHFTPSQAETVVQLLHTPGENELASPEYYETLIDLLHHDRLPLRGLAHWHLVRLVPEGRKFNYQATQSKEEREKAVEQWKKLIPAGTVPAAPKPEPKK